MRKHLNLSGLLGAVAFAPLIGCVASVESGFYVATFALIAIFAVSARASLKEAGK